MQEPMRTRCLDVAADAEAAIREGVAVLAADGVLAFPTETVYGLGVCWGSVEALHRLRAIKGREEAKPFQVLIADPADAVALGASVSPRAARLMERFWPGPLTLVLPAGDGETRGLRVPASRFLRELIRRAGTALVATSANRAGEPPAQTAEEVLAMPAGMADLVLDGGPARLGVASTVARVLNDRVEVLRVGAIPCEEILRAD